VAAGESGNCRLAQTLIFVTQVQRFYFHFSDLSRDVLVLDWKGQPCETPEEAIAYAKALADGLVSNSKLRGSTLIVSDGRGQKVETITIRVGQT
jgi:hypothetical protein